MCLYLIIGIFVWLSTDISISAETPILKIEQAPNNANEQEKEGRNQKGPETEKHETATGDSQPQTSQSGVISASPKEPASNPKATGDNQQAKTWMDWYLAFGPATWANWAVVIVAILAGFLGFKTFKATLDQAKAATRQTAIMEDRERPVIMMELTKDSWPVNPVDDFIAWSLVNVGRTPAFLTKLSVKAERIPLNIPDIEPDYGDFQSFAKFIIPPGGRHTGKEFVYIPTGGRIDPAMCIAFWGRIDYEDTGKSHHVTRFFVYWRIATDGWIFEPVGPTNTVEYT